MIKQTINNIQNPAIGGYLIWRVSCGYFSETQKPMPIHLSFLVMPFLLNDAIFDKITSTYPSSTLYNLTKKLTANEFSQISIGINAYKDMSFRSLLFAAQTGLITYEGKDVIEHIAQKIKAPIETMYMGNQAEKLGKWFSRLSLPQITRIIMVK